MSQTVGKRVIKVAISVVYLAICSALRWMCCALGRQQTGEFFVIYYHAIPAPQKAEFAWQMDCLLSYASVVPADATASPEGRRRVAVTFDDAFVSVLENAVPVLRERRIPAALFVPTAFMGRSPGWLQGPTRGYDGEVVMTAEQVSALRRERLFLIGAHGVHHVKLVNVPPSTVDEELVESKRALETLLQEPITLFCFPWGSCDAAVVEHAKRAGYSRVFSIVPLRYRYPNHPPGYLVGRIPVDPSDWRIEFHLKIRGAYGWMVHYQRLKLMGRAARRRRQGVDRGL